MTIVPPPRRSPRPALDGYGRILRRQKHLVVAVAIRDGLLFALILHAVTCVVFAPGRGK